MARRIELEDQPPGELLGGSREPRALGELTAVEPLPILIVDDVPENLSAVQAVLEPLGAELRTAQSGEEALRLLLEEEFALILLDVRMPGIDGLETARMIKQRDRTRDIPIVFLTAAADEVRDIVRGYGIGAVDYMLKPIDAELLRSKVAVFAQLEASRRALKRSEAFLRGAFEAAPIGKTVLDHSRSIVRGNPAFARLLGTEPAALQGVPVLGLCHVDDRDALSAQLDRLVEPVDRGPAPEIVSADLRLTTTAGAEVWVAMVASVIELSEQEEPMLLVQWVDLSARRRAEQARAELLLEQAAREQAEAMTDRLSLLQALTAAMESLTLDELLAELALRLAELFYAELAEVQISDGPEGPVIVRARGGRVERLAPGDGVSDARASAWQEEPLMIERSKVGTLRLALPAGRRFSSAERSMLRDAAERAALGVRRALLHEEEHRTAVELQRGLLPKQLPSVAGVNLAAHYEAAGAGAEVGGDWYDAFALPGGRLGIVLGDVAGRSIPAASAMGQLRTVTRAFALSPEAGQRPGDVLSRLNAYQVAQPDEVLFTVLYAIVDPTALSIAWAAGGHPPPVLRSADRNTRLLEGGDGLIGIESTAYRTFDAKLASGDVLILYTDGLVERRGETLDAGLARLARLAADGPDDLEELCRHLLHELVPADERLADDVTALLVGIE